jgi:hypothetical protein
MNNMEFYIENLANLNKLMYDLQLDNSDTKSYIRQIVKAPMISIENKSKINLTRQKSIKTGNLLNSFRVRSQTNANSYESTLQSNSPYVFPIDRGTVDRFTKDGRWTGAVGKATTDYKGRNKLFQLRFIGRAIDSELPTIERDLSDGIERVINSIIARNIQ